jgi:flagellar hook assembly protein FlgD
MLGKKVRTLVNEYKHAGDHSINWDGLTDNGLLAASGLYLYKLKTNGTQISKSMSLVR